MTNQLEKNDPGSQSLLSNRWMQLILGIICMSMIANMQYGWTLFVEPMKSEHPDWTKAMIQVAFTLFVLVAAGGLIATAQLGSLAKDWGLDKAPVTLFAITMPALTMALSVDRILNGLTRPFFGWVSDRIGRERTMFWAFLVEGLGIFALWQFGSQPVLFVILTGLVFFAWGEIYSLFPSTCTDTFGSKYAAGNAGLLYTAKGTASLLVPIGALLVSATGSWDIVFVIAAVMNIGAGLMAKFVLKPMRQRWVSGSTSASAAQEVRYTQLPEQVGE